VADKLALAERYVATLRVASVSCITRAAQWIDVPHVVRALESCNGLGEPAVA
jgi:hypothetical protein